MMLKMNDFYGVVYFVLAALFLNVSFNVHGNTQSASSDLVNNPSVKACKQITRDELRLNCYDELFEVIGNIETENLASSAESSKNTKLSDSQSDESSELNVLEKFGAEDIQNEALESVPNEIASVIVNIVERANGKHIYRLENGQAWRAAQKHSLRLREGDKVEINKGVFTAYFMSSISSKRRVRVDRVK